MDKRALSFIVFLITLCSTLLVAFISFRSGHSWINLVLYTVTTMWIVGVISQLMMHYIYLSIIRPIEEEKFKKEIEKEMQHSIPIDEVEKIDDISNGKLVQKAVGKKKESPEKKDDENTQLGRENG